jgi:energy-coupling factor transporter ATP-binding protein EcfA2
MDVFVEKAAETATTTTPILRVVDVVKSYGSARVLDGVGFEVARRQVTGLIGPNGAGKTTLFNLIAGVDEPDSGAIFLREQLSRAVDAGVSRVGISRTFRRSGCSPAPALENIMVGCRGDDEPGRPCCAGDAVPSTAGDWRAGAPAATSSGLPFRRSAARRALLWSAEAGRHCPCAGDWSGSAVPRRPPPASI